jgi:hypothetical protein
VVGARGSGGAEASAVAGPAGIKHLGVLLGPVGSAAGIAIAVGAVIAVTVANVTAAARSSASVAVVAAGQAGLQTTGPAGPVR